MEVHENNTLISPGIHATKVTTFSHDGRGPLQVATYPLLTTYSLQTHIQRSEVAACKGLIKDPIRQLLRGGGRQNCPSLLPPPRRGTANQRLLRRILSSIFRVLRHRAPSSPIYLSEVIHKPLALSRVFLLSSGGKSVLFTKKKATPRSGFSLSSHVVLKTRHVSPNIHVRRY